MHLYNVSQTERYNIMVLHIKRMSDVKRSACENPFLTAHMRNL
jgi:hypothetical protein